MKVADKKSKYRQTSKGQYVVTYIYIYVVCINYQLFQVAKSVKTEETLECTLSRENFETRSKIIDSMVKLKHLWTILEMYLVHKRTTSV